MLVGQDVMSLIESTPKITLYPQLIKVAGSATAGIVLSQLVYWFSKGKNGKIRATIEAEGRHWTAMSAMYAEQFYGMTRQEFRTALDKLHRLGVVLKRVWKYNGSPTTHLSLDCNQLHELLASDLVEATAESVASNQTKSCQQPIFLDTSTSTSTCSAVAALPAVSGEGNPVEEGSGKEEGEEEKDDAEQGVKVMSTIKDALAKIEAKKALMPTKANVSSLVLIWKKRMSMGGDWVKDPTGKDAGQLKHFLKAVGDQAPRLLDWALLNWATFAWEAKGQKGLATVPEKPHIGFILAHVDVLVNLHAKKTPTLDKTKSEGDHVGSSPTQSVGLPKVVTVQEDKYVATPEEIAATFAALEKLSPQQ